MRRPILPLALALVLCLGAPAWALPGDPPVTPVSPADGASLPTSRDGIPVSYACPVYRSQDFGLGVVTLLDERSYVVMMSRSPALDAEGRLADPVVRVTGSSTPADPNICNVLLAADASPAPQETPGRWYWQVSRLCAGCSPPFETGPVRSFTLVPSERPALRLPDRIYAGYPFIATVSVRGAPAGTAVTVQRAVGSRWATAGRGTTVGDGSDVTTTLPAGSQRVRVRLDLGGEDVTSPLRRVRVRRPGGAPVTAVRAGSWSGASGVAFRVTGRTLRGFAAQIPLLCPTPGMVSQFTTQIARAAVARIRLAPDGSFVGAAVRSGSVVRVRGRLRGSRLAGGRVEMSLGACVGNQAISARAR